MTAFSKNRTAVVLLLICVVMFLSPLSAQNAGTGTGTAVQDEKAIVLGTGNPAEQAAPPRTTASSSIWIFVRIVLALVIVTGGIYGVVFFLKKTTRVNAGNDPYIKNLASLSLSPNKSVQILSVGSRAFLVGVTDQNISLLSEITDRELVDAMILEAGRSSSIPVGNFASVFRSFFPGKSVTRDVPGGTGSTYDGNTESFTGGTEFLRKQRERLQNVSSNRDDNSGNGSAE